MKTIVSVCSARPNFVKLAAVHHALKDRADFTHVIIHTGQHYDPLFSDIFFEQLDIPLPAYNLGVHGGTREEVIDATAAAIEQPLRDVQPDIVLVYGDVNGAVGAARAAQKLGIRIGHVEAGLRSFDMDMPEEHNRIAVDNVASLLFCTEQSGMQHLEEEKIGGKRFLVGNTMIDTLIRMMPIIERESVGDIASGPFGIVTLHRPSNVDDKQELMNLFDFLGSVSQALPLVLPAHHRLKASIEKFHVQNVVPSGLTLIEPLGYLTFLKLLKESQCVFTDSGGIQEEAVYLGKRCFTLRRNTERPSTIESGSNVLINPSNESDRQQVLAFAANPVQPAITIPQFWDGKAGQRIVDILKAELV